MSPSVSETSTVSPSPFSPFSSRSYSSTSGATSDDAPDLGAFPTVFRELTAFYPPHGRFHTIGDATPTSAFTPSDYESEVVDGSTVWNHRPIASYLSPSSPPESPSASPSITTRTGTDSIARYYADSRESGSSDRDETEDEDNLDDDDDEDQPSLGFAGALDFLAAERAKFIAQLDAMSVRGESTTSDRTWRHPMSNRRKRRRKRNRSVQNITKILRPEQGIITPTAEDTQEVLIASADDSDDSSSEAEAPSSPQQYYKSTPSTPPPEQATPVRRRARTSNGRPPVHHSKSTPALRLPATIPIDARVLQLRNLAHKLRMLFPKDAESLAQILSDDHPSPSEVVDPRGPVPRSNDTLIHVFIDHSNILFGFLSYLRSHGHRSHRKPRHLSHAALALILERGRPVTRRVLVTSSPLYQPMESAEQLGYEVKILRRVPDDGEGADRQQGSSSGEQSRSNGSQNSNTNTNANTNSSPAYTRSPNNRKAQARKGHNRGPSHGGGTSESEVLNMTPARIRYREQAVDELLQLKLHQAIADVDVVPENATIVLATGDGNVGQFNEDGFLGCVRVALKKGWKVELYSWEGSLSKAWARDFGDNKNFVSHLLDRFVQDLVEL
ncbi:hypothetical protein K474DRAFT_1685238 [Panus rudis PR-1116 ss-1]|nr:hypothetical protein K474DRAFT_1685238 [Panus rudis PR-1116 ss-1]